MLFIVIIPPWMKRQIKKYIFSVLRMPGIPYFLSSQLHGKALESQQVLNMYLNQLIFVVINYIQIISNKFQIQTRLLLIPYVPH